ncbi:MAG TPA: hypothetical protein VFG73_02430 [Rhodanobacteraceae bacterium]|nr:hypothetical protein [Rhodanobacteraceae bacterium]
MTRRPVKAHAPDLWALTGELVLVTWEDSHQFAGWHTDEPAAEPLRCHSAGRLVRVTGTAVVVAGHWTEEAPAQRSGEMTIPRSAIRAVEVLRWG